MQFSSKPPFNDDPEPWLHGVTNMRIGEGEHSERITSQKRGVAARTLAYAYEPRPEFDRPKHNPTNPILTEFRNLHEATGNDLWTDAYLAWSDLIEENWTTHDEYFHAFKVLGKIVSVTNPMKKESR